MCSRVLPLTIFSFYTLSLGEFTHSHDLTLMLMTSISISSIQVSLVYARLINPNLCLRYLSGCISTICISHNISKTKENPCKSSQVSSFPLTLFSASLLMLFPTTCHQEMNLLTLLIYFFLQLFPIHCFLCILHRTLSSPAQSTTLSPLLFLFLQS